jgi:glycosyltransferase involved in cell wall biosynthesis
MRRGHDVTIWICNNTEIDWMEIRARCESVGDRPFSRLPRADVCIVDRHGLAAAVQRAGIGITAHICQGFDGTDAQIRLSEALRKGPLGWLEAWKQWRRLRQIDRAYRLPTAKLVVHPHLAGLIRRRYGQESHLVPNGLPDGVFTPQPNRTFEGQTILVVGQTSVKCKRLTDAFKAVGQLKKVRPNVRLIRASPDDMDPAEKALGVADEYHARLNPADMASLYRRADIFVCTSNEAEGFGLPLLEALACGLPAVVTDISAFREFAEPRNFAHFTPVGDPMALSDAIARLLDDSAERRRLSRRGIEVAGGYTMERSFQAMEQALVAIMSEGTPTKAQGTSSLGFADR